MAISTDLNYPNREPRFKPGDTVAVARPGQEIMFDAKIISTAVCRCVTAAGTDLLRLRLRPCGDDAEKFLTEMCGSQENDLTIKGKPFRYIFIDMVAPFIEVESNLDLWDK